MIKLTRTYYLKWQDNKSKYGLTNSDYNNNERRTRQRITLYVLFIPVFVWDKQL